MNSESDPQDVKPTPPAEVLSSLVRSFPGLIDGEQDVNGADLVNFFNKHRGTLEALAAKGEQSKRRRAKPKFDYVVEGTLHYAHRVHVTDPKAAVAKFIKKYKSPPQKVFGPGGYNNYVGQCAVSGEIILSSDDYGSRLDPDDPMDAEGNANMEFILHEHADPDTYIPRQFRGDSCSDDGNAGSMQRINHADAMADLRARRSQDPLDKEVDKTREEVSNLDQAERDRLEQVARNLITNQ